MRGVLASILLVVAASPLFSQVTIVRTLPETGAHMAEAEWKRPTQPARIDKDIPAERPDPRLSGRLIIGGYGSAGSESVSVDDLRTDSRVDFNSYLGQTGVIDLNAQAFRTSGIGSFNQHYRGSMRYASSAVSVRLHGGYTQSQALSSAGENDVTEGRVGFNFATSQDVRVPLELSYAFSSTEKETATGHGEGETERVDTDRHSFSLASGLDLDRAAIDLAGEGSIHHDRLGLLTSHAYGGTLGLRVPLAELFAVYLGATPSVSRTERQIDEEFTEERSVKVETGLLFSMEDTLEGDVRVSRTDAWRSDPDGAADDLVHATLWGGSTSWKLQYPHSLTSSIRYILSASSGTLSTQDLSGDTVWSSESAVLDSTGVSGRIRCAQGERPETGEKRLEWGAFIALSPVDGSHLETRYGGSRAEKAVAEDDSFARQHDGDVTFSHAPLEAFSYGAGVIYRYTEEGASEITRYGGSAFLTFMPVLRVSRWSLGSSIDVEVEQRSAARDYVAVNTYSISLPVTSMVRLRYEFTWEWVGLGSGVEQAGSAYTHSAGLSLSGDSLPVSFTSRYLGGHGFRGVKHQVDARLEVPVARSFSIISETGFRYAEDITYETPYEFSVLGRYEF